MYVGEQTKKDEEFERERGEEESDTTALDAASDSSAAGSRPAVDDSLFLKSRRGQRV